MLYLAERSEVVDNLCTMCPSLIRETMSSKEIANVFYRIVKHCIWCPIGDGDTTYVFKSWKFWCAVARCAFANMDDYVNAESILLGARLTYRQHYSSLLGFFDDHDGILLQREALKTMMPTLLTNAGVTVYFVTEHVAFERVFASKYDPALSVRENMMLSQNRLHASLGLPLLVPGSMQFIEMVRNAETNLVCGVVHLVYVKVKMTGTTTILPEEYRTYQRMQPQLAIFSDGTVEDNAEATQNSINRAQLPSLVAGKLFERIGTPRSGAEEVADNLRIEKERREEAQR